MMRNFEITLARVLCEMPVPQAGTSSGHPASLKPSTKPTEKFLTVDEIIKTVRDVPYYNNVVDDFDNKDYSWDVYKKVAEYANYLKSNPKSLQDLPPVIVVDGGLQDGAHRISAIYLLANRLDPENSLWKTTKLKVHFVTKDDLL